MTARRKKIEEFLKNTNAIRRKLAEQHFKNKSQDLSGPQWLILKHIHHAKAKQGIGIKEIADSIGITSSGVTQMVNTLDKKGYIQRKSDPKDRRNIFLTLSKKAEKQMASLTEELIENLLPLFSVLTNEEFSTYCQINQKLADQILSPLNPSDAK